jgi:hypothetical protein
MLFAKPDDYEAVRKLWSTLKRQNPAVAKLLGEQQVRTAAKVAISRYRTADGIAAVENAVMLGQRVYLSTMTRHTPLTKKWWLSVEATGQKPLKVGKTGALMMWHKNGYLDCSGSHLTVG